MTELVSQAVRHARLRWLGAPLLLSGVGLLGVAVYESFIGGSLLTAGLGAFGSGLALASFGANHDTAMALSFQARDEALPRSLKDELAEEMEKDRNGLIGLRPAPKIATTIPVVALAVQVWVAIRLFGPIA